MDSGESVILVTFQIHYQVPQHCVGRVLGKMGATINEIQEASNTDIKMNQEQGKLEAERSLLATHHGRCSKHSWL